MKTEYYKSSRRWLLLIQSRSIEKYKSFADYRCVLAGIVTVGVITTIIDILVNKLEKTLIKWEY